MQTKVMTAFVTAVYHCAGDPQRTYCARLLAMPDYEDGDEN